jgi:hypothetical protein
MHQVAEYGVAAHWKYKSGEKSSVNIDEKLEWIIDSRARNGALREILAQGDRRELIVLVNTILDRIERSAEIGRKITAGDENTLKRAKKMLLDEFATTTDLKSDEELMGVLRGEHRCAPKTAEILK